MQKNNRHTVRSAESQNIRGAGGFTLVEMLVLLIIIGIIAIVFFSSGNFIETNDLERHAALVSARISNAKNQAVLHGWSKFEITASRMNTSVYDASSHSPNAGGAIPGESTSYAYDGFTVDETSGSGSVVLKFDSFGLLCTQQNPTAVSGQVARFRCPQYTAGRNITLIKGENARVITVH